MNVKEYLDIVCEQIRFQKAHFIVKKELKDHINDQAEAFVLHGMDKKTAFQKAIEQMGDPVLVGTELDRVHRPKCEWSFIVFMLLFLIGNMIIRWTIWRASVEVGYPMPIMGINNIISIVISIFAMAIFYYIDFTILAHRSHMIYAVYVIVLAFIYMISALFAFHGSASIWIHIFSFHIIVPPLIYLFPVVLVGLLYDCRGKSYTAILLCGASFLLPAFFSYNIRLNTALFMVGIISFLLIVSTICKGWFKVNKVKALLMLFVPMIAFVLFLYYAVPQFVYRIKDFHFGITDMYGVDFARNILQQNIKGASLFGTGQSFSYYSGEGNLIQMTPENFFQGSEYFTNYALHYFGWIVCILFLTIYFFFMIRGFVLAHRQKSQLGNMTAFAILLTISVIAIWNIVTASGFFIHVNPLEMPFLTSGGTTTVIYSILIGILLSVFRTGKYASDSYSNTVIKNNICEIENQNDEILFTIRFKKRQKKRKQQKGEKSLE